MTIEQQTRIAQLRTDGIGYKRIAETLGMSASTVKSYCRRNGLNGRKASPTVLSDETHSLQIEEGTPREADASACRQCGRHIDQTPGRKVKRFCSDACRMKWWRAHKEQIEHQIAHTALCPGCGQPFEAYGVHPRKYCGRACYLKHRFKEGVDRA